MFALVDANNFYASCERVFQPGLARKPIAVLSNNDGCVIARSAECKALGIGMAEPYFACKARFTAYEVQVFSANFALYGDMSNRLMHLLAECSGLPLEIYSIDEAFLDMHGLTPAKQRAMANQLCATSMRWLGLPISVGIGASKTLAKLANHLAKQQLTPIVLDNPSTHRRALEQTRLADIWGIGKRICFRLQRAGLSNAAEFADFDPNWVKQELGKHGERLQLELNGIPCAKLAKHAAKKQVLTSRSFGQKVTSKQELREALVHFCVRTAEKLRAQGSLATWLDTALYTAPPGGGRRISHHSGLCGLPVPTNDPRQLAACAWQAIDRMFDPQARYAKAGVLAGGLLDEHSYQQADMFSPPDTHSHQLWQAVDKINQRYGRDTMYLAAQVGGRKADAKKINTRSGKRRWHMNQRHQSPHYTTEWAELLTVQ